MMKKKTPTKAKKTAAAKKPAAEAKTSRAASGSSRSKYDQPGAPWWKKIAAPQPKGL